MRTLTASLLTAQHAASATPFVQVTARNCIAGALKLTWSRLYTGSEADYYHALAIPGDGSLIRVRITPPAEGRRLYRQRVANPGPEADFSQWSDTGQYNAVIVAACALGAEVSIFWINSDRAIYHLKSSDHGASWASPQIIDYSPTTAIYGIAAAYKPNGDIGLFFADQTTIYAKYRVAGSWQTKSAWNQTTGNLSGLAASYNGDFNLLVTGQDTSGNYKLWSLIYGDGGELASGTWSALQEVASAPADGHFEYRHVFLDKTDTHRCFFVERFTGSEAYSRPFWSYAIPGAGFAENLWHEPVPFNLASEYGLAIAHHEDYVWLSGPSSVWRADLVEAILDLSEDVLSLRYELSEDDGRLTVELDNSAGKYHNPGTGTLAVLDIGSELAVSSGYVTSEGGEVSPGLTFWLTCWEHTSTGDRASLILHARDGWGLLRDWQARQQCRWNKAASEMSVRDILAFLLARCGLRFTAKSQSSTLTSSYPDFTISPASRGDAVTARLFSLVPDVVYLEGGTAWGVNPLPGDSPVYSYGAEHPIREGKYRRGGLTPNRIQVEGSNPASGAAIISETFSWTDIERRYDRTERLEDRNLVSLAQTQARGSACLRHAEMAELGGAIRVMPNCGAELYDVIEISDARAGLVSAKRRVIGLTLSYDRRRAGYEQTLLLGRV